MTEQEPVDFDKEVVKPKRRGITNKCLVLGVIVTAIGSISAYVYQFNKKPLSASPGDWADFATYLSGTVGVAAVVATLLAFVITLKQQQKLIESQDDQLCIAKTQLDMAKENRAVERAYEAGLNVLPLVVDSLRSRSEKGFPSFSSNEHIEVWNCAKCFSRMDYKQVLENPHLLTEALESEVVSSTDVDLFVKDYFSEINDLCLMAFELIGVDSNVYYIFDSNMKKDLGGNMNVRSFVKCYCSYRLGLGDSEFVEKAIKYLKFEERQAGNEWLWHGLGERVREKVNTLPW